MIWGKPPLPAGHRRPHRSPPAYRRRCRRPAACAPWRPSPRPTMGRRRDPAPPGAGPHGLAAALRPETTAGGCGGWAGVGRETGRPSGSETASSPAGVGPLGSEDGLSQSGWETTTRMAAAVIIGRQTGGARLAKATPDLWRALRALTCNAAAIWAWAFYPADARRHPAPGGGSGNAWGMVDLRRAFRSDREGSATRNRRCPMQSDKTCLRTMPDTTLQRVTLAPALHRRQPLSVTEAEE